jgi:hypothetical protein
MEFGIGNWELKSPQHVIPPERDKVSCQNSFQPPGTPKHTDGIRNWKLGIEEPRAVIPPEREMRNLNKEKVATD